MSSTMGGVEKGLRQRCQKKIYSLHEMDTGDNLYIVEAASTT